jgi:N-formylmaleamate deformylase
MVTPAHWKEQYADVGDVRIRYHRTGGNKPQIVLLHGITDNGLCWTPVAKELEEQYDVIMPDARGHGKTSTSSTDFSIKAMADDGAKFIRVLGLDKPIVLGHSMGGQVTTLIAAQNPDLVSKIVLEDPAFRLKKLLYKLPWLKPRFVHPVKGARERSAEEIKASCKARNPAWSDDELDPWAVAQQETARNIGEGNVRKFDFYTNWYEVFPRIKCPALFIIPSNGALTLKATEAVLPLFKDSRIAFIADAGHSVRRDQFQKYMVAVRNYLDRPKKN